jgi:dihydropyrimidinase
MSFDLVIRDGLVTTATEQTRCDVGIVDGKIASLGSSLINARKEIDAKGMLVVPGGIDSHCHIEQMSSLGIMNADDFYSGTVSAAFGGTTTIIPFAAQHRGQSLKKVVDDYHKLAGPKAVIDYAFHMIISDPTPQVLTTELPDLIERGYQSFKVFMTYDLLKLDDYQILEVLALARRRGALTMVHAENHDMIRWLADRLIDRGHASPKFHAVAHAPLAEEEATSRVIYLSELLDVPIFIVHVSAPGAMDVIRAAQSRGLQVYAETCPQYLFLTADDLDKEAMEGAKFCCSPPPRDHASQEAMWRGIVNGTFQIVSSDHAPFRFDKSGKLIHGTDAPFKKIPNGIPGLEVRMPLLFSEGVQKGRIDIHRFIDLTATRPAKLFGLFPQKGTIATGSDADLAIWDANKDVVVRWENLHDNVGYSPYEGRRLQGWPVTVISRGRVVVQAGQLDAERGSGRFLSRARLDAAVPLGRASAAIALARHFGANDVI